MKKIFLLTLICMLSLSFVACEKKDEVEVISADDIEQNEDFQKVLLQTPMVKSEPMTTEERVNYMLSLYKNCFGYYDGEKYILTVTNNYKDLCKSCVIRAFEDTIDYDTKNKLIILLVDSIRMNITKKPKSETGFDFDSLIQELEEKTLEILK